MSLASQQIAVVVPAHQAEAELGRCLPALLAAGFAPQDIVVVDDGSRDATSAVARGLGVMVLRNETPQGAAEARNRGVTATGADIVLFVDADVVVHADVRERTLQWFRDEPSRSAVIGSYDAAPPAPSIVGRYRNLLHHYVHQHSRAEAPTFWTGLGAVRREAFLRAGGFDRSWEKIEDAEFGVRLRRGGGSIRLDPDLQATHLKVWTLGSMFRTDLFGRAVPWSRLVLFNGGPTDDLNLAAAHRVSVVMVGLLGIGLVGASLEPRMLILALAALAGFVLANQRFLGFLVRREGLGFAIAALPYHLLHYLAAGLGYAWVLAIEGPRRALESRVTQTP